MKTNCLIYQVRLIVALSTCLFCQSLSASAVVFESIELEIAGKIFDMEVAKTPKQQRQGLMFRKYLADQSGMIFLYPQAGNHRIWMRNTLIPLTVIWFDEHARVIDIKNLKPCRQRDCPVYGVDTPSKFVVELNHRFNALKPGDQVPSLLKLE